MVEFGCQRWIDLEGKRFRHHLRFDRVIGAKTRAIETPFLYPLFCKLTPLSFGTRLAFLHPSYCFRDLELNISPPILVDHSPKLTWMPVDNPSAYCSILNIPAPGRDKERWLEAFGEMLEFRFCCWFKAIWKLIFWFWLIGLADKGGPMEVVLFGGFWGFPFGLFPWSWFTLEPLGDLWMFMFSWWEWDWKLLYYYGGSDVLTWVSCERVWNHVESNEVSRSEYFVKSLRFSGHDIDAYILSSPCFFESLRSPKASVSWETSSIIHTLGN
jgi:hypothetical protein